MFINRFQLKSVVCTAVSLEKGTCLIINKIIINRFVSRVFYIFVGGNVSIFLFFFFLFLVLCYRLLRQHEANRETGNGLRGKTMCVMAMLVFSLRATEQVASKGSTLLRFSFFFFRFRVDKIVRDRRVCRDSWDS